MHAVLYYDGTTVGELPWANTLLGRRERLSQRLSAIATLLDTHASSLVGTDPVSDLKDAKRQDHLDLPEDDMRVVDDVAFHSAISTLSAFNAQNGDDRLRDYSARLRARISSLRASMRPFSGSGVQPSQVPPRPLSGHTPVSRERSPQGPQVLPASLILGQPKTRQPGLKLADIYTCSIPPAVFGVDPADQSTVTDVPNACGPTNDWELKVAIENTDQTANTVLPDVVYDAGPERAWGTCWKGYDDCNGAPQPGGAYEGLKHFSNSDDGFVTQFSWIIDNWFGPTESSCSECDPAYDYGKVFTAANNDSAIMSPTFYFEDETTSPGCVVNRTP